MSEEDFAQDKLQQLAKYFKELEEKPKLRSKKGLKSWLIGYANWTAPRTSQSDISQDNDASSISKKKNQHHIHCTTNTPKLPFFSVDRKGETS